MKDDFSNMSPFQRLQALQNRQNAPCSRSNGEGECMYPDTYPSHGSAADACQGGNAQYHSADAYQGGNAQYHSADTYQGGNAQYHSADACQGGNAQQDLFITRTGNEWMKYADSIKDPVLLWREFFVEGELCCLFADANLGKSILAVQIALDITKMGKRVLYIDFEMSAKQFQLRYMDADRVKYVFPDSFIRAEVNPEGDNLDDIEGKFMPSLIDMIQRMNIDVVIVDNLTWVARTGTEKGDVAGLLMKALIGVKRICGVSMLVLAHTPKRDMTRELTQNDLAGSKMLINFFDAAFAIGRSATKDDIVYLKQIKSRSTPIVYGTDNVVTFRKVKTGGFLHMEYVDYEHERHHLRQPKDKDTVSRASQVCQMALSGMKGSEIAAALSVSRGYVSKVLKQARLGDA